MLMYARSRAGHRRGVSLVLVCISLVGLFGMVAISLEGGLLLSERRNAQSTADAAAQAAAADLY
ncbi:MAG TPA: pilus assembly protein TadG-related protein, partial [Gemmataceae bacterium]|nr:pilus assembly protein TadG-related protein [Gemmataceae bacterium]